MLISDRNCGGAGFAGGAPAISVRVREFENLGEPWRERAGLQKGKKERQGLHRLHHRGSRGRHHFGRWLSVAFSRYASWRLISFLILSGFIWLKLPRICGILPSNGNIAHLFLFTRESNFSWKDFSGRESKSWVSGWFCLNFLRQICLNYCGEFIFFRKVPRLVFLIKDHALWAKANRKRSNFSGSKKPFAWEHTIRMKIDVLIFWERSACFLVIDSAWLTTGGGNLNDLVRRLEGRVEGGVDEDQDPTLRPRYSSYPPQPPRDQELEPDCDKLSKWNTKDRDQPAVFVSPADKGFE